MNQALKNLWFIHLFIHQSYHVGSASLSFFFRKVDIKNSVYLLVLLFGLNE